MRGTSTARMQLSDDPVETGVTVPGKKVTFIGGGGLDLGNIVPSNRRGQGFRAPIAKPPKVGKKVIGKIASASSGNKRGREGAAASPAAAVASSPVVRPPHTTKFLREVSVGMKKGNFYTLTELAKGLGLPPFVSSTKAELEECL